MKQLFIIVLFISTNTMAQLNHVTYLWKSDKEKADDLYESGLYEKALDYYTLIYDKDNDNDSTLFQLANCYMKLGKYDQANLYYDLLEIEGGVFSNEGKYNHAESLLSVSDYERAEQQFESLLEIQGDKSSIIQRKLTGISNIDHYYADSAYAIVENMNFNTSHSEFGAFKYRGDLFFASTINKDLIIRHDHLRDVESLLDVFYVPRVSSSSENASLIELTGGSKGNNGPITMIGDTMVVTRNIGYGKDNEQNSLGLSFYLENKGKYELVKEFPYNNKQYSLTHPKFTHGKLYFSSDMLGGYGGMDIYYSLLTNGSWSEPINAGETINTQGDEVFPFESGDKLYFSSTGHSGLGGLDTYWVSWPEINSIHPHNMGYPINTGYDDFGIFLEGDEGYISSNRPEGKGSDDIYAIKILPKPIIIPETVFSIQITDHLNEEKLSGATVVLENAKTLEHFRFITNEEGIASDTVNSGQYSVFIKLEDYQPVDKLIWMEEGVFVNEKIIMEPDLDFDYVRPDSILFELNDYKLLPGAAEELDKLVETMNKYPNLKLQILAYTDARGKADYNLWLSNMRASSAANYLTEKDISMSRIVEVKGYGEEHLLNHCADGIKCSDEEHSINRRIEFILIPGYTDQ